MDTLTKTKAWKALMKAVTSLVDAVRSVVLLIPEGVSALSKKAEPVVKAGMVFAGKIQRWSKTAFALFLLLLLLVVAVMFVVAIILVAAIILVDTVRYIAIVVVCYMLVRFLSVKHFFPVLRLILAGILVVTALFAIYQVVEEVVGIPDLPDVVIRDLTSEQRSWIDGAQENALNAQADALMTQTDALMAQTDALSATEKMSGVMGEVDDRMGEVDDRMGEVDDRMGEVDDRMGEVDDLKDSLNQLLRILQEGQAVRVCQHPPEHDFGWCEYLVMGEDQRLRPGVSYLEVPKGFIVTARKGDKERTFGRGAYTFCCGGNEDGDWNDLIEHMSIAMVVD